MRIDSIDQKKCNGICRHVFYVATKNTHTKQCYIFVICVKKIQIIKLYTLYIYIYV